MNRTFCLLLLCGLQASAQAAEKHRVLFNRFRVPEIGLFLADADGKNERALPHARERVFAFAFAGRQVDRLHLRARRAVRHLPRCVPTDRASNN